MGCKLDIVESRRLRGADIAPARAREQGQGRSRPRRHGTERRPARPWPGRRTGTARGQTRPTCPGRIRGSAWTCGSRFERRAGHDAPHEVAKGGSSPGGGTNIAAVAAAGRWRATHCGADVHRAAMAQSLHEFPQRQLLGEVVGPEIVFRHLDIRKQARLSWTNRAATTRNPPIPRSRCPDGHSRTRGTSGRPRRQASPARYQKLLLLHKLEQEVERALELGDAEQNRHAEQR